MATCAVVVWYGIGGTMWLLILGYCGSVLAENDVFVGFKFVWYGGCEK